jgi:PAS domain-containing protein
MTPESQALVKEKIQRRQEATRQGLKFEISYTEAEMYCKDGSTIWVEILPSPVFNSKNELIEFQGVTREITDRKRMEAMVNENTILLFATLQLYYFRSIQTGFFCYRKGKVWKNLD